MRNHIVSAIVSTSLAIGPAGVPAFAQTTLPVPANPGGPQIQPPRPSDGYKGSIRCESRNNQMQRCNVRTDNRVAIKRVLGGRCTANRTWGYSARQIWVSGNCRAEFHYGYAGAVPVQPGNDFAGTVRCESRSGRYQQCSVTTHGRVELARRLGGTCNAGRQWGYTANYIWVNNGCRADFRYGYNNLVPLPGPEPEKKKGPSTGLIIGGIVVAGGLLALLASGKKKAGSNEDVAPEEVVSQPGSGPAALSADLGQLPAAARPSVQNCMNDAARQIGVTGGTRLSYDRLIHLEQGNGGWRIRAAMTATYPEGARTMEIYCRATPTQIVQLDFS